MTLYLDTSVVVSALTNEVATTLARAFLRETDGQSRLISWWVEVGWNAAISSKLARTVIDPSGRTVVDAAFKRLRAASFTTLAVHRSHFTTAGVFVERAPGLRAGDALHLAIAAANEATICTLDVAMAAAARRLGLAVVLIGTEP